ncbi:MAG: hypothetical protein ABSD13_20575 [Candidatus Korobacteraceae bacterium]
MASHRGVIALSDTLALIVRVSQRLGTLGRPVSAKVTARRATDRLICEVE